MRLERRLLLFPATVLCSALVGLPAATGLETSPTIEAKNEPAGGIYAEERHLWSPAQATVAAGGSVRFENNGAVVPHGVEWIGSGPKPTCDSGVPVGTTPAASGTSWSGSCSFTQAGTYNFYCTVHGAAMRGTITVTGPTATTSPATAVSETGATLHGTINPKGQPTSYLFKYGTSAGYGQNTAELPAGGDEADHAESAVLSGLAPGTLYHFQIVAVYASGAHTTLGADATFTTASPPAAPTVSSGEASALSEAGATLNGTVDPQSDATTYFFKYGTSTSYGQSTSEQQAGADNTTHQVSATLSGLVPGTVYHFQLVAHNSLGTITGADRTFTTASTPAPPVITQPPTQVTITSPPAASVTTPTPAPTPTPTTSSGSPSGPAALATAAPTLALASTQHGGTVHGAVNVPAADAAARLEVDLLAPSASLASSLAKVKRPGGSLVGRFTRSGVKSGKLSFTVPLTALGKRALRRHHRLAVTVVITLTPNHGAASTITRKVVIGK